MKTPPSQVRALSFVALDFETTGSVAGLPIEAWQIGLLRFQPTAPLHLEAQFESLLQIGERPFNPHAPGRHAQLRAELAQAPSPQSLWPTLSAWFAFPLVAHNAATEASVLTRLAPLQRFGPWIDTLKLTRRAYPHLPSYALSDLVETLQLSPLLQKLCPGRAPHDALYDAYACALLFSHLIQQPGWHNITLTQLTQI